MIFLLGIASALKCEDISVSTQIGKEADIIRQGKAQKWPLQPHQGIIPLYVTGLDYTLQQLTVNKQQTSLIKSGEEILYLNITKAQKDSQELEGFDVFILSQECSNNSIQSRFDVKLTMKFDDCQEFKFQWEMICGEPGSTLVNMNIGFSPNTADVLQKGVLASLFDGDTQNSQFQVPNTQDFTEFYFYKSEGPDVYLTQPEVYSNSVGLSPFLSGFQQEGISISDQAVKLTLYYNCQLQVVSIVSLMFDIPRYQSFQINLLKHCSISAQSSSSFIWILFFLILITLSAFAVYKYTHQQRGFKLIPFGEKIKLFFHSLKKPSSNFESQLPDFQLNESDAINLNSQYGTI